jgi:thioredoxin 1
VRLLGAEDTMSTVEITQENFKTTISKPGIVVLDWWATWCGPCKAFAPVFEAASAVHTDIVFGKIDTDEQQELARAFRIRSIPTLMVFRDGIPVFAQPGALPKARSRRSSARFAISTWPR